MILVVGLTTGLLTESAKRTEGVGADMMIQPPSASIWAAFSGAPMPISIAGRLRNLDYVQAVAPVLVQFNSVNGARCRVRDRSGQFSRRFRAGSFSIPVAISRARKTFWWTTSTREAKKIKAGQNLHILGHDFKVAGIVEHGKGARLFVLISGLQEMSGAIDKASIFYVKCDRSDHTPAVTDEIHGLLPGYEIRPLKDFINMMTSSNLPGVERVHQRHDQHRSGDRVPCDLSLDVHHDHRTHA